MLFGCLLGQSVYNASAGESEKTLPRCGSGMDFFSELSPVSSGAPLCAPVDSENWLRPLLGTLGSASALAFPLAG